MAEPFTGRAMDLENMRANGCRSLSLDCACGHEAVVNADQWPGHLLVPDMRHRFRCSRCGQRPRSSRPDPREFGGARRVSGG